jgi:hypothetical protein
MLSKVYEWSRVTHPTPDDDYVAKRTVVVQTLTEKLSADHNLVVDCACAAAGGVIPRFAQDSDLIKALIDTIREKHPAYPAGLAENNLDLRVVCALAVGEIAERAAKGTGSPSAASQLASSIVVCGLAHRPLSVPKHMRSMMQELLEVCALALQRAAKHRRVRYSVTKHIADIKEAPEFPAFWSTAKVNFRSLVNAIEHNQANDREEIDTLWWAFNGVSIDTGLAFSNLPLGVAVLRSAGELARLVKIPPLPSTKLLLSRAVASGRGEDALSEQPMRDVMKDWEPISAASFLSDDSPDDLVRNNPAIFPISWMCQRHKENGVPALNEFKKATGWDPTTKISPDKIAFQAFNELIAQRVYTTHTAE